MHTGREKAAGYRYFRCDDLHGSSVNRVVIRQLLERITQVNSNGDVVIRSDLPAVQQKFNCVSQLMKRSEFAGLTRCVVSLMGYRSGGTLKLFWRSDFRFTYSARPHGGTCGAVVCTVHTFRQDFEEETLEDVRRQSNRSNE